MIEAEWTNKDSLDLQPQYALNQKDRSVTPNDIMRFPSADSNANQRVQHVGNFDLISRQAAIDEIMGQPSELHYPSWYAEQIKELPSAYPDRLTDDDFETIRIHLNAHKEALCNQHRWEEAEEYQRIIDRFMGFASAQKEIIRCRDCKHRHLDGMIWNCPFGLSGGADFFCAYGAKMEVEHDSNIHAE